MQWTYGSFKEQLQTIAGEMKSGVGNINTQFAMFKAVVSPESTEYGLWKQVIAGNGIEDYTKTFLFKMENPEVKDDAEIQHRINTAKTIYEGMV